MKAEYVERAKEVGTAYAVGLCKDFTKHGSGWLNSIHKFPYTCGRIASVSLFTCFSDDEWYSLTDTQIDELKSICCKTAVEKAKKLLDKEIEGNG